ncbi:MAG: transposase [Mariniphaga sp.]|nr:transposase [Mariniphaga sp.]
MQFAKAHIYHIYNRGNNSQPIFFSGENYLFFLKKVRKHILSHADILAWCLMPNHFHLMVYVNEVEVEVSVEERSSEQVTESHQLTKEGESNSEQVTGSHQLTRKIKSHQLTKKRLLNDSISILLRSYTRAIQNQNNITGSLFQHRTKAICLTEVDGITPAWFESRYGIIINITDPEKEYPQVCFNYIHQNPVKSGLVKSPDEWEFSSYRDYVGLRDGKLINREKAAELGLKIL